MVSKLSNFLRMKIRLHVGTIFINSLRIGLFPLGEVLFEIEPKESFLVGFDVSLPLTEFQKEPLSHLVMFHMIQDPNHTWFSTDSGVI